MSTQGLASTNLLHTRVVKPCQCLAKATRGRTAQRAQPYLKALLALLPTSAGEELRTSLLVRPSLAAIAPSALQHLLVRGLAPKAAPTEVL